MEGQFLEGELEKHFLAKRKKMQIYINNKMSVPIPSFGCKQLHLA